MANKAYLKYREQELKQLFKAINKKGITSVEIAELIRETKKRLEAARKELASDTLLAQEDVGCLFTKLPPAGQ